jgi:hypothetical protein
MTAPTPGTTTPERIVEIATGYMAAKQLFAASRIGLFQALADGPRSAAELATATGTGEKMVRILADTMNAKGLLERHNGRYSLSPDATEYLTGAGAVDLGPFLGFLNQISYGHWLQFDSTVERGKPGELQMDEAGWGTFMSGVMQYNALHAAMLARAFDFTRYRSMLDLGGLSPAFAIGAMQANPQLRVRFAFAPMSTEGINQALDAAGLADRASVEPAETETAAPGGEHDLIMVNHVIHRFSAEQNRTILSNVRAAAATGATLLLLDFFLDTDQRQRPIDALHAGEYFVIDGTIVYPEDEVRSWLESAGWHAQDVLALPGSPRVLVARAV